MTLSDILSGIFFPSHIRCFVCDKEIFTRNPFCLCEDCEKKIDFLKNNYCKICGTRITGAGELCLRCQNNALGEIKLVRSVCEYSGVMKEVVQNFKYNNKQYLSKFLSKMMFYYYFYSKEFKDEDLILPIPMFKKKVRKRGYNQTFLLAKDFEITNKVDYEILIKIKDTDSQTIKTREERLKNLEGSFAVLDKKLVKNKKILLLDDVFTTGATCLTATKLLKKCGAKQVKCLTLCSTTNCFLGEDEEKN